MALILNEIHSDPANSISGDANGDGTRDSADDEFVEIVNTGPGVADISGYQITDAVGVKHTFPPGTTLAENQAIVVFGGGTPTGAFGGAVVQTASSGELGLNNGGDTVSLLDASSTLVTSYAYGGSEGDAESITLDPDLAGSFVDHSTATGAGGALFSPGTQIDGAAFCFAAGTLIATPDGENAVESLSIGDLVTTSDGGTVPVLWIGRQTLTKRFHQERAQMVRINAGALGNHSDLFVTGDHGMIVDGFVINAAVLVNHSSINWVSLDDTPERQTVYHVETENHDVILANGAASETYLDIPSRATFDNYDEYLDLYGKERTITENPLPRISTTRLLPARLKQKIVA